MGLRLKARAPLLIVSASRLDRASFQTESLLGRSLQRPEHSSYASAISTSNSAPLALAYNAAIEAASADTLLVFCHDDVDLGPLPLEPQLKDALQRFDLVGVAGNQRHQPGQIAWWLDPGSGQWDYPFLSGAIEHGQPSQAQLAVFGPVPMPVQLLDGVFLVARAAVLQAAGMRFDPRLPFHFYDFDFCRSARRAGLSLGTWPLPLLHASGGDAHSPAWNQAQQQYLNKWGEQGPQQDHGLKELFRAGRAQEKAGAWAKAEQSYRQLLVQAPGHGPTQLQLAKVVHQQDRNGEALALLDGLLASDPQPLGDRLRAKAQANRGALLQLEGDLDGAEQAYGEALRLDPALRLAADNLLALALQLRAQGRCHQALEALRRILRADPQRPDLLLQLGISLMELGRVETAVPCFKRLLRHEPQHPEGHYQLGQALAVLGEIEAGIGVLQTALALDPEAVQVLVTLEWHRLSLCDWDNYDARMADLIKRLEAHSHKAQGPLVPPLTASLFPLPPALHRRLGERWAEPTSSSMAPLQLPSAPPRQPGQRLRLGYLSADFRNHAMGNLIHGLFAQHDRSRFEVFAYSLASLEDDYTAAIRQGVDQFSLVAGESSEAIAARIRADRIDVLIDLMGHTHHSRPGVLAMRPAPLQLHYLGYPGSLGADWIDGVIADAWLIPPEHERHYRETVHRLPWGFVSSAPLEAPAAQGQGQKQPPPNRESLGLPATGVVYACFNRPEKLTPPVFDSWLEILRQVPGSVLWVVNDQPLVETRLRASLVAAGLGPERLVVSAKVESAAFAQLCSLADLLLDTSPYGSGATAVTALAAGLPLLTCPGESFASRMGASLCAASGLEALICPSPQAYTATAIALGRDPAKLQSLRRQLLEGSGELPLLNTAGWVGELEILLERLLASGETA